LRETVSSFSFITGFHLEMEGSPLVKLSLQASKSRKPESIYFRRSVYR